MDDEVQGLEVEGEEGVGGEHEVAVRRPVVVRQRHLLVQRHPEQPLPAVRVDREDERPGSSRRRQCRDIVVIIFGG